MKTAFYLIFVMAVLLAPAVSWSGQDARIQNTPIFRYGDFCTTPYGYGRGGADIKHALESLSTFFGQRGLEVRMTGHDQRFIRANIYNGASHVDSIIMDMRTGKMRSTY